MFQVLVSPGTVGTDSFVLQLMSGEGDLLPAKEATLVLSLPGRRHRAPGAQGDAGRRRLLARRPMCRSREPGRWHLRVEAVTAFRKITLEDDFEVPAP